jgi:hypothetical protein
MPRYECGNCGQQWTYDQLQPIVDLWERIEPGGEVPIGECPECGALCCPPEGYDGDEPMKLA